MLPVLDWLLTPGGALTVAGLAMLLAAALYWLLRRWRQDASDDAPTEIVAATGAEEAAAFLVALETSLRMPQQVALYAGRETRFGRDRRSNTVTLPDISISRRHASNLADVRPLLPSRSRWSTCSLPSR